MLATSPARRRKLVGNARPRISPPVPARNELRVFRETAAGMGITLMPWQETAGKYLTATGPDGHLYREVCIVVARQQGKTTLMKPLIIRALRAGQKVMHIAQTRELPRHMFGVVADALSTEPDLFPRRRGKVIWPRYGAGQEEIVLANGGAYRIASASSGGARGWSNDLVVIDELREMDSMDVIAAVRPTLRMAPDPQMVYLSNAGHERSIVLNGLRARADGDPALAYLEWSAAPDRAPDDQAGWLEANPAIGHFPQVMADLERDYTAHRLAGSMPLFETESLCRWVVSMDRRYLDAQAWADQPRDGIADPLRTWMGISMDASGERASAVLAWPMADGTVAVSVVADVTGAGEGLTRLGADLRTLASDRRVVEVAYDPWTDTDLARYLPKARAVNGREYANASAKFVERVEARGLRVDDAGDLLAADLGRLTRKSTQAGSFMAVRANEQESATAAIAAIRAVWLATVPGPSGIARIY